MLLIETYFFFQIYPHCAFLNTNILKYVIVHNVHCISVCRSQIALKSKLNIHTLHALVKNFLLMDK
jgi:hypothetical protein